MFVGGHHARYCRLGFVSQGGRKHPAVYGNANLDNVIDEDDIEYVQGILDGTEDRRSLRMPTTMLISEKDIVQIRR